MTKTTQREHPTSAQMLRLAQHHLAPLYFPGEQVAKCTLGEIKHRKSSVTVTYELVISSDQTPSANDRRRVFYRTYFDGSTEPRSRRRPGRVTFVPEVDGYMWMLPDDPKMTGLPKLLSGDATVINYKPEDRCTVRVGGSTTTFGKIFESSVRAERAFEDAHQLWETSNLPTSRFEVPRPLLLDDAHNTMWCDALLGSTPTVKDLLPETVQRIAHALASWHCSPMRFGRSRTSAELFRESRRKGADLSRLFPGLGPKISVTLDNVEKSPVWYETSALRSPNFGPIHGAFRLRQLLISDQVVGIVDFDSVGEGDQLEDLTDVFYDLTVTEMAERNESPLGAEFLKAYGFFATSEQTEHRFRCHLALQALKRAHWLRSWAVSDPRAHKTLTRHVHRAAALSGGTNQPIEESNDLTGAIR